MTSALRSTTDDLLARIGNAFRIEAPHLAPCSLEPMADTGLAHNHIRIVGSGLLARVPKQSQIQLDATANLAYQAACFQRAMASGHTPRLERVLQPSEELTRGALIVEEIVGRPARLPQDLDAIAIALAAIHLLDAPPLEQRPPLRDPDDPLADLRAEIEDQARHIGAARLDARVTAAIERELGNLSRLVGGLERPPKRLISFDAHPGNFVIRPNGDAVLVDLEKARYGYPSLDLAHATLYTSTTWDVATYAELSLEEIAQFYDRWADAMGPAAASWRSWHVDLRRAMWLWSVTWCAKWRVSSSRQASDTADGEDWSAAKSDPKLIAHVRDRVDCYLSTAIVERIGEEFTALDRRMSHASGCDTPAT